MSSQKFDHSFHIFLIAIFPNLPFLQNPAYDQMLLMEQNGKKNEARSGLKSAASREILRSSFTYISTSEEVACEVE
jgi:hypothetical protein